jgi:hypothetical protein
MVIGGYYLLNINDALAKEWVSWESFDTYVQGGFLKEYGYLSR